MQLAVVGSVSGPAGASGMRRRRYTVVSCEALVELALNPTRPVAGACVRCSSSAATEIRIGRPIGVAVPAATQGDVEQSSRRSAPPVDRGFAFLPWTSP